MKSMYKTKQVVKLVSGYLLVIPTALLLMGVATLSFVLGKVTLQHKDDPTYYNLEYLEIIKDTLLETVSVLKGESRFW